MRYLALFLLTGAVAATATPARADIIYGTRATDVVVATSGDDFSVGPLAIPFSFSFYGAPQASVFMNSNGNLSFGAGFTAFTNTGLPVPVTPLIAPFWDDMFLPPGQMRVNTSVAGEFAALWNGVGYFSGGGANTFEAILLGSGNSFGLADGSILFSYGSNTNASSSPTVGISNGAASAHTLAGLLGSSGTGTLTGGQATSLVGRSFLFTPGGASTAPTYTVTEVTGITAVPAPPAVVLVGIGAVALAGWRRLRRKGEPALAV